MVVAGLHVACVIAPLASGSLPGGQPHVMAGGR